MSPTDIKTCDHCGAKMQEYCHVLNVGLVRTLVKIYEKDSHGPVSIAHLGLDSSQYTNYPKLAYWSLTARWIVGKDHKGGVWRMTEDGRRFLRGLHRVRKKVVVYRNRVLRFDGPYASPQDIDDTYKIRPEYVRDYEPHGGDNQASLDLGGSAA